MIATERGEVASPRSLGEEVEQVIHGRPGVHGYRSAVTDDQPGPLAVEGAQIRREDVVEEERRKIVDHGRSGDRRREQVAVWEVMDVRAGGQAPEAGEDEGPDTAEVGERSDPRTASDLRGEGAAKPVEGPVFDYVPLEGKGVP